MKIGFIKNEISNSSELSNRSISESSLSMQIICYRYAVSPKVIEVKNDDQLVSKNRYYWG